MLLAGWHIVKSHASAEFFTTVAYEAFSDECNTKRERGASSLLPLPATAADGPTSGGMMRRASAHARAADLSYNTTAEATATATTTA